MPIIELATKDDVAKLFELEQKSFNEYEQYSENQLKEMFDNSNYYIFKLHDTQKIISYIILIKVIDECEILKICTQNQYKNSGYATQLLDFISDFCKQNSVTKIFLEVRQSNQKAISLYKNNNFVIYGTRKNYYVNEDAILMQKSIT